MSRADVTQRVQHANAFLETATDAQSPVAMSPAVAQDAIRWASRLVEAMDGVLSGP